MIPIKSELVLGPTQFKTNKKNSSKLTLQYKKNNKKKSSPRLILIYTMH